MIIWTIKLVSTARRALAGRKYPHQLAWAVAFGLLLGLIPHGNLLAVAVLLVVLSLKINHAMAGLTTVGATFVAGYLDPYSHRIGEAVLTEPRLANAAAAAWQYPLVPWTDLNNTVVMGSFLIGVGGLLPVFCLTYPIFRITAPKPTPDPDESEPSQVAFEEVDESTHGIMVIDGGHRQIAKPHRTPPPQHQPKVASATGAGELTEDESEVPRPTSSGDALLSLAIDESAETSDPQAIETRIDVIRMTDYRDPSAGTTTADGEVEVDSDSQQPMDEALNYLLRQLRDSQQRKVA